MHRLPFAPSALLLLGLLVALGILAPAAGADVLVLTTGDLLYGQLDGTSLPVETREGVIEVQIRELRDVLLDAIAGDVLRYRNGTVLTGWIGRPSFALRLPSGQTVSFPRTQVAVIGFPGR